MAINKWEPKALAVAQQTAITIAGVWTAGDTVTITINTKDLVITIGSLVTTTQVAQTIKEAWEGEAFTDTTASVNPAGGSADIIEHNELTATAAANIVTLTGDVKGVDHLITVTEITASTGTATGSQPVSATGPNDFDNADNWSLGTTPGATDDLVFENSAQSVTLGLDELPAVTSMTVRQNYTGDIGRPLENPLGYREYRSTYLTVSPTTLVIGNGDGSGSGRIKIDLDSVQSAITVENTGAPSEFGLPAVQLLGTNASNTLDVNQGSVGVGVTGSTASTIATARLGSGNIEFGPNVTLGTITVWQAEVLARSNITTLTSSRGNIRFLGSATIGTLTVTGGTVNYLSSGTITTLNVGGPAGGVVDFSEDTSARTVTNCTLNSGGRIVDPLNTVTFTNGIQLGADTEQVSAA